MERENGAIPSSGLLTPRELLRGTAFATTVGAIAPFAFVPSARALKLELERLVRRQRRRAMTPNIAAALAGYVAESWRDLDFDELCRERILPPLGMDQSGSDSPTSPDERRAPWRPSSPPS